MSAQPKRFIYKRRALTPEESRERRAQEIEHRRALVADAQAELIDAITAPLLTEVEEQIEVMPSDPEYDTAPYQGEWRWINNPVSGPVEGFFKGQ